MVGVQELYIYVTTKQALHPQTKLHKDFRGIELKYTPSIFPVIEALQKF